MCSHKVDSHGYCFHISKYIFWKRNFLFIIGTLFLRMIYIGFFQPSAFLLFVTFHTSWSLIERIMHHSHSQLCSWIIKRSMFCQHFPYFTNIIYWKLTCHVTGMQQSFSLLSHHKLCAYFILNPNVRSHLCIK